MKIRKTDRNDLEILMKMYENARMFMAGNGNPMQWGNSYPSRALLEADTQSGHSYVCTENDKIIATFYYRQGIDETYTRIYDGQWQNDLPYGVVHRIASDGTVKGAASFCLDWAFAQCRNLKIDTHRDNIIMQHVLTKNGFQYCGIIYLADGSERLAYQKQMNEHE